MIAGKMSILKWPAGSWASLQQGLCLKVLASKMVWEKYGSLMSIVLGQRITSLTVLMPWQMVLVTMEKMLESYVKILSFLQVRKIEEGDTQFAIDTMLLDSHARFSACLEVSFY
jgi:hypothetical protein